MLNNLVSIITKSLSSSYAPQVQKVQSSNSHYGTEGSGVNPFLSTSFGSGQYYGKNQPVAGGYFAGYYNGKPNIVGRRLFIEV